jgi:hypothetical protein
MEKVTNAAGSGPFSRIAPSGDCHPTLSPFSNMDQLSPLPYTRNPQPFVVMLASRRCDRYPSLDRQLRMMSIKARLDQRPWLGKGSSTPSKRRGVTKARVLEFSKYQEQQV